MVELFSELWDMILQYFREDLTSLRTCSLVARDWIPVCRARLFETLVILEHDNEDHYKAIFESNYCTITQYVCKIIIRDGGQGRKPGGCLEHLPVFPFVTEVTLDRINWSIFQGKAETWITAQMKEVATLMIHWPTWYNAPRLVIAAAPHLRELHIQYPETFLSGPDGHSRFDSVTPPRLRKLGLVGLSTKPHRILLEWISPVTDAIEELHIQDRENISPPTLKLLRTVASQLKHLTLQVLYTKNAAMRETVMDVFSSFVQLETLSFGRARMDIGPSSEHHYVRWMADLQDCVTSPVLSQVTLKVADSCRPEILAQFHPLDRIYESSVTRGRRTVLRVEILDKNTYQSYRDGLLSMCPLLAAHHQIECVLVDDGRLASVK